MRRPAWGCRQRRRRVRARRQQGRLGCAAERPTVAAGPQLRCLRLRAASSLRRSRAGAASCRRRRGARELSSESPLFVLGMPSMGTVARLRPPRDGINTRFRPSEACASRTGPAASRVWLRPEHDPGGRWRRVGGSNRNPIVICNNGPTLLPQLQRETPTPQRYGRPSLTESEPERVEFAAWGGRRLRLGH